MRVDFRYIRRTGFFWDGCGGERRWRSRYGLAIPSHALNLFAVRNRFAANAYLKVTPYWQSMEVPRGCHVKLPMVFTYKARELRDPQSGWWVVAYTEFAAKTAAFILFEVYDSYRLWALSGVMIANIRALDLPRVLGSRANADELERLLRVIERTDFSKLPNNWSRRGEGRSLAPGRRGAGADYLFYNPHNERAISYEDAYYLFRAPRARMPVGHPVGWDYEALALFER